MAAQRPAGSAPVSPTGADEIPLADGAVDAALAILTIHHWPDVAAGLREMQRVARRVVILTWDPGVFSEFWLFRDYLPAAAELDRQVGVPIARLTELLPGAQVEAVPVPFDCTDGFAGAFWRRPAAYLDATVRRNITSLARNEPNLAEGLAALRADVDSGAWNARYANLLELDELDLGYRLVVLG